MTTNAPDAIPAETEQLPCPFCGGTGDPKGWLSNGGKSGAACDDCGASAPSIEMWNRRTSRSPLAAPVAEVRARYSGEDDFGERDVSWLVKPSDLPSGTKLYSAIPAPGTAPSGTAEVEPVASIVPPHCTSSSFAFEPGVLCVNKDGSGYIAIDEDDFACEDDRCEGPDGPEGSVHWIARLPASEITALRDFLNGVKLEPAVEVREPDAELVRVLTVLTNKLRAEASRGPVSSREIFNLTDPIMDALSKHGGNDA